MGIALDDLYGELRYTYDHDTATALIGAVREEIASELAEEIRTAPVPENVDGRFGAYVNAYLDGSDEAADLIDPAVE